MSGFSVDVVSGGYAPGVLHGLLIAAASLVGKHRFQVDNFSSCVSRALAQRLSRCVVLIVPWHVGSSQTKGETHIYCIGKRILHHWSTWEAPYKLTLFIKKSYPFKQH